MSGIEIAGLVLATVPLFIELGKASSKHISLFTKSITSSRRDEGLEDFYEFLLAETILLDSHIHEIIKSLPYLSNQRKDEIRSSRNVDNWREESDVAASLRGLFSKEDLDSFLSTMDKFVQLFARLLNDDTVHLLKEDKNRSKMYEKLKVFQADHAGQNISSDFLERFKFLKRQKDRDVCLKRLERWNSVVGRLVDRVSHTGETAKTLSVKPKPPSSELRTLSQRLFVALSKCWNCSCQAQHEAKFCLSSCGNFNNRNLDEDPVECGLFFDFLISHTQSQGLWKWYEATVTIKSSTKVNDPNKKKLETICDPIQSFQSFDHCLQLLVEDFESRQLLWRLSSRHSQLTYLHTKSAVSFDTLLRTHKRPSLPLRRKLAVMFAYSLLQLHESPWLSNQWDKDKIYFFYTPDGLDFQRPYLKVSFDHLPDSGEEPDLDRFHPNLGILKLGTLLIEVHKWKTIESFRIESDLRDGQPTPNTDQDVASRILNDLDDCFPTYQEAIKACLEVPWVSAGSGSRVSLDDQATWSAVCGGVITNLQSELKFAEASVGELQKMSLSV